jgi:serine/threonine protein phosphatase PrpC
VAPETITSLLMAHAAAADAADALVEAALAAGGSDNITVLVARFVTPQQ